MNRLSVILTILLSWNLSATMASAAPRSAKPQKPTPVLPPPEMHRDSSRFFTAEQMRDFVELTAKKLEMSRRTLDPFALPQDPDWKPKVVAPEVANTPIENKAKTPFRDVINRIRITTIMPAEKRFMVNGRPFDEGSEIRLNFGGEMIRTEVVSISSSQIVMRNADTNEIAALVVNLLPSGMQVGKNRLNPLQTPENEQDAPIILDESQ